MKAKATSAIAMAAGSAPGRDVDDLGPRVGGGGDDRRGDRSRDLGEVAALDPRRL